MAFDTGDTGSGAPKSRRIRMTLSSLLIAAFLYTGFVPITYAQGCIPLPPYASEADRIGVNVVTDYGKGVDDYDVDYLNAGWFIDYRAFQMPIPKQSVGTSQLDLDLTHLYHLPHVAANNPEPEILHDMGYAHVLRATDLNGNWRPFVTAAVERNLGMLWIIGNEPDRDLQDGMTAEAYAQIYHDAYTLIKQLDPTSQVAIAGVVQPTPLRLRYLDQVLAAYEQQNGAKMPIDVWNVHAFILREAYPPDYPEGSIEIWGAGIPLGLEAYKDEGILYDIDDHGDIELFKQGIRDFRTWMKAKGYRNTPLLVTEYGILMPPDYTAPDGGTYDYDFVREFMLASFDFMRTAKDSATGYPADGNRLVQSWSWFGLNNYVYNWPDRADGFNGNLVDHDSGVVQPLGDDFAAYTSAYEVDYTDLAFRRAKVLNTAVMAGAEGETVEIDMSVFNRGNVDSPNSHVRMWLGEPDTGTLLAAHPVTTPLVRRCRNAFDNIVTVKLPPLSPGQHELVLQVVGNGASPDRIPQNDEESFIITAQSAASD